MVVLIWVAQQLELLQIHSVTRSHLYEQYTKQYTSTCDPTGKVTIGLIVQNGCDSAVVSFQVESMDLLDRL